MREKPSKNNSKNSKKPNIQKDILKLLANRPAVSMEFIKSNKDQKTGYAVTRSVKNLVNSGYVEILKSDNQEYLKITPKGQNKLTCLKLSGSDALVPNTWDGFWRIIILDLPENRKSEREALRYLLKKANFACVKNTLWISPHPYENLFINIKKDLGLDTELMILMTDKDKLDPQTNQAFLEAIKE